MRIWPDDKLNEALQTALANGAARVILPSGDDAQRFRFALYNYRKSNSLGLELIITVEDNACVLKRAEPSPEIVITSDTNEPKA